MVGRNFLGDGVRNEFKSRIYDVFLEQRLLKNLSLEVGGHWEEWKRLNQSYVNYTNFGYYLDLNQVTTTVPWANNRTLDARVIPSPMTAQYTRNPNFGKLFTTSVANGSRNLEQTREFRASLAWEPTTPRSLRWLGRHSFFGSYNYRDSFQKAQSVQVRLLGNLQYQAFNGTLNNARRVFLYLHYFDAGANVTAQPPVIGGKQRSLEELLVGGVKFTDPTTGQAIELSGWNSPYGGSLPRGDTTRLESGILAWQGKFLDRLILSYGLRNDQVANKSMNVTTEANGGPNQSNGGWQFFDHPAFVTWDDSTRVSYRANSQTYGAVVRPLPWLSLSYYESSTFNLPTGQFPAFGDPIPGTNGNSKEYALRFDLPDGKSYLKFDRYKLTKLGSNVGFGTVRIAAGRMETSYQKVVEDRAGALGTPSYDVLMFQQGLANPNAWTADDSLNSAYHPITGDTLSQGYEITGGTRFGNLDIRLTAAKAEALQGNVSRDWENWMAARLPIWSEPNLTDMAGNKGWDKIPYQGNSANNYTKLLGNVRYRVQLNARNLWTEEKSFRSSRVNAFGESVFTVIETPRTYSLSLDLMFWQATVFTAARCAWAPIIRTGEDWARSARSPRQPFVHDDAINGLRELGLIAKSHHHHTRAPARPRHRPMVCRASATARGDAARVADDPYMVVPYLVRMHRLTGEGRCLDEAGHR